MSVINDILDIAKIEAGRLEIERRDFDLHDLVEASCEMVAATAVSKGLELQSFVHDGVPRFVRGDRMRVSQILANLVGNAVKFTAEGEVVLEVGVAERTDHTITVRFDVRDTGIGIPPDRVTALFDPFTQADAGTTRQFGGTGLGLTISRELTDLMGGSIDVESAPGEGSTFRLAIPFTIAEAEVRARVPATELGALRVLVVDDNATNRRIFEAYVASWGMRSDVAGDGAAAVAQLHRGVQAGDPYDIALLDFNMPGENGLELASRITAEPSLRHTRLILLTSSGQIETGDPTTGIRSHLSKPVRQSRLLDAISEAMAIDVNAEAEPTIQPTHRPEGSQRTAGGRRILVAEDQHINWMLIERTLAKRGDHAVNATDGHHVLELLAAEHYDLVLMDCQMPVLDGYDTTREIRRRGSTEHNGRIPIVAMTANAMHGDRERCLAAGMDDYIPKPIDPDLLEGILARWLPPTQPDTRVLDPRRLDELRSLFTSEEMTETLQDIAATITTELDNISQAITRNDRDALVTAAHRVKNSAGMIGATALAQTAAQLQSQAEAGGLSDQPLTTTAMPALLDTWQTTRPAIEAEAAQPH